MTTYYFPAWWIFERDDRIWNFMVRRDLLFVPGIELTAFRDDVWPYHFRYRLQLQP